MSILQIVYKSIARAGLEAADVLEILRVSQIRNQGDRISGLLIYRAPVFVQLLEGPGQAVEALYARIAQDPRHHTIEDIARVQAARAVMPTWAMGYFSPGAEASAGANDSFVFDDKQVRRICAAMPAAIGAPFLAVLGAEA